MTQEMTVWKSFSDRRQVGNKSLAEVIDMNRQLTKHGICVAPAGKFQKYTSGSVADFMQFSGLGCLDYDTEDGASQHNAKEQFKAFAVGELESGRGTPVVGVAQSRTTGLHVWVAIPHMREFNRYVMTDLEKIKAGKPQNLYREAMRDCVKYLDRNMHGFKKELVDKSSEVMTQVFTLGQDKEAWSIWND